MNVEVGYVLRFFMRVCKGIREKRDEKWSADADKGADLLKWHRKTEVEGIARKIPQR